MAELDQWSLHTPSWVPVSIASDPITRTNKCLELRDEDPYDQAVAERTLAVSRRVHLEFRILLSQIPLGRALEFEVQDEHGGRPLLLRFDTLP